MAGGGTGGTNGALQQPTLSVQPRPVDSPFGNSLLSAIKSPQELVPRMKTTAPQAGMTYENALSRNMQQDVKSPEEQAAIDAAIAGGPGGPPVPFTPKPALSASSNFGNAPAAPTRGPEGLGMAVQPMQPACNSNQQPYGMIKPMNPFQPQNFEQRLSALEEWQKTRV
jgi:hypothetical protein